METMDEVALYVLYGFRDDITIDLETADFEWLETHCDGAVYARARKDLPVGYWRRQAFAIEIIDSRIVSRLDNRARLAKHGAAVVAKRSGDKISVQPGESIRLSG